MKRFFGKATLAALSVLALTVGCSGEVQEDEPVIRPVRYQPVYATGGSRERTFSGVARAGVESNLSFKVPGNIKRLAVSVGDEVRRGAMIAELDDTDYRLQVQDAQASLTQAQSQARNARLSYDRVRALYENNNASRSDLDAALASRESADAQVASVEKKLELAQQQLDYTRLTAPVGGRIASVNVEVNENVGAGQTIVMLTAGDAIEVEIAVPEILIARVRAGQDVKVMFDAIPNELFAGSVTEVGVTSQGFATTYPVVVKLSQDDARLRPGMAAEVRLTFNSGDTRERFVVPSVAVAEDQHGRYVYLLDPLEDGLATARRQSVEVGDLTSEGIEITEGLSDGDLLVTAGVSRIVDGQTVRIGDAGETK